MNDLNTLTRTFHDATISKITINDNSISIYMTVYEIGDCYGCSGYNENRELLSDLEIESFGEYNRQLQITFYNIFYKKNYALLSINI